MIHHGRTDLTLAIDPSNPNTIYAGTGEQNNSSHEYGGAGVLKSPMAVGLGIY
jgi:hypothetical protein